MGQRRGTASPVEEAPTEPVDERNVYRESEWPHGLACPRCDRVLEEGDEYVLIPEGESILLVVCAECSEPDSDDEVEALAEVVALAARPLELDD